MKYGKFNLEVQIPHLTKLAEYYEERYIKTKDWTDCLKVRLSQSLPYVYPINIAGSAVSYFLCIQCHSNVMTTGLCVNSLDMPGRITSKPHTPFTA